MKLKAGSGRIVSSESQVRARTLASETLLELEEIQSFYMPSPVSVTALLPAAAPRQKSSEQKISGCLGSCFETSRFK